MTPWWTAQKRRQLQTLVSPSTVPRYGVMDCSGWVGLIAPGRPVSCDVAPHLWGRRCSRPTSRGWLSGPMITRPILQSHKSSASCSGLSEGPNADSGRSSGAPLLSTFRRMRSPLPGRSPWARVAADLGEAVGGSCQSSGDGSAIAAFSGVDGSVGVVGIPSPPVSHWRGYAVAVCWVVCVPRVLRGVSPVPGHVPERFFDLAVRGFVTFGATLADRPRCAGRDRALRPGFRGERQRLTRDAGVQRGAGFTAALSGLPLHPRRRRRAPSRLPRRWIAREPCSAVSSVATTPLLYSAPRVGHALDLTVRRCSATAPAQVPITPPSSHRPTTTKHHQEEKTPTITGFPIDRSPRSVEQHGGSDVVSQRRRDGKAN